tara:strand:+ start:883 stop:1731 length:849 start_codon:yes stop_codon:yes gene_type:complete
MNILLNKNFKYFLAFSFVIISFLILSTIKANSAECSKVGTKLVFTGTSCNTAPDTYEITLYKIYICRAEPSGITTSATHDMSTCELLFEDTAGEVISIPLGGTATLTGTLNRPPNGSYISAVFLIDNYIGNTSDNEYTTNQTGTRSGSGTGAFCATVAGSGIWSSTGNTSDPTTCSTTDNLTAGVHKEILQTLTGGSFDPDRDYTTAWGRLVDSNDFLATAGSDVDKFQIVSDGDAANPFVFTNETSSIDLSFRVSQGMSLHNSGGNLFIGGGPFVVGMTVN